MDTNYGKNGLINQGSTCFFNSIIQVLLHTDCLMQYLLSGSYEEDINKEKNKEVNVFIEFIKLARYMWGNNKVSFSPTTMLHHLHLLQPRLFNGQQQDAHECFMYIFDILHRAVSYEVELTISNKKLGNALKAFKKHYENEYSALVQSFVGQYSIITMCENHHVSYIYEPFNCITLELPEQDVVMDVSSLLKTYCECIDIEKYECDECKKSVEATRHINIQFTRDVIIFVLKRFLFKNEKPQKIGNHIRFKEILTNEDFLDSKNIKHSYLLYGIIVHAGEAGGGHYYAFIKHVDDCWYCFNDQSVTKVSPRTVFQSQAYMLFYKKQVVLS